jgi:hypothetical protein
LTSLVGVFSARAFCSATLLGRGGFIRAIFDSPNPGMYWRCLFRDWVRSLWNPDVGNCFLLALAGMPLFFALVARDAASWQRSSDRYMCCIVCLINI